MLSSKCSKLTLKLINLKYKAFVLERRRMIWNTLIQAHTTKSHIEITMVIAFKRNVRYFLI